VEEEEEEEGILAMHPKKFTHKTNEVLAAGQDVATEAGHAQYTPAHPRFAIASHFDAWRRRRGDCFCGTSPEQALEGNTFAGSTSRCVSSE
jgi:hypothetical protein